MKAQTKLHVEGSMLVTVELTMNVTEMRSLLELLGETRKWPSGPLATILRQTLARAANAYESEEVVP